VPRLLLLLLLLFGLALPLPLLLPQQLLVLVLLAQQRRPPPPLLLQPRPTPVPPHIHQLPLPRVKELPGPHRLRGGVRVVHRQGAPPLHLLVQQPNHPPAGQVIVDQNRVVPRLRRRMLRLHVRMLLVLVVVVLLVRRRWRAMVGVGVGVESLHRLRGRVVVAIVRRGGHWSRRRRHRCRRQLCGGRRR
jgi:hypothetical protein